MDTQINEYGVESLGRLGTICDSLEGGSTLLIVSDERIWAAEGQSLMKAVAGSRRPIRTFLLPGDPPPYADDRLVATVKSALAGDEVLPLAFGAGTINDAVKRASFELGRRYVCVPSAPSVDGYASYGAAITVKGFKVTLECPAPLAIVADSELLARAPAELIAAGYGDLVAKVPAGVDWMIADAVGVEKIDRPTFDLVQPLAMGILDKGKEVRLRDAAAIGELYQGLAASGLAMQSYRDSRPASGAEHLLSHVWEMDHLEHRGQLVSHGFKVAIGTLATVTLQREMFSMTGAELEGAASKAGLEPLEGRLATARREIPAGEGRDRALEVVRAKTLQGRELAERRRQILAVWEDLRQRALARLPPLSRLRQSLQEAGCPIAPEEIGLSRQEFNKGIIVAALIRKRYTILDLASEFALLESLAETAATSGFSASS